MADATEVAGTQQQQQLLLSCPDEVLILICDLLDADTLLASVRLVCRRLRAAAEDSVLWRRRCKRRWPREANAFQAVLDGGSNGGGGGSNGGVLAEDSAATSTADDAVWGEPLAPPTFDTLETAARTWVAFYIEGLRAEANVNGLAGAVTDVWVRRLCAEQRFGQLLSNYFLVRDKSLNAGDTMGQTAGKRASLLSQPIATARGGGSRGNERIEIVVELFRQRWLLCPRAPMSSVFLGLPFLDIDMAYNWEGAIFAAYYLRAALVVRIESFLDLAPGTVVTARTDADLPGDAASSPLFLIETRLEEGRLCGRLVKRRSYDHDEQRMAVVGGDPDSSAALGDATNDLDRGLGAGFVLARARCTDDAPGVMICTDVCGTWSWEDDDLLAGDWRVVCTQWRSGDIGTRQVLSLTTPALVLGGGLGGGQPVPLYAI